MYNLMSARQRQANALGWDPIKGFIDTAGRGIRADRERALLSVAYDTMGRIGELVALNVEDVTFYSDGTGRVLIRRSKTDQAGEHRLPVARHGWVAAHLDRSRSAVGRSVVPMNYWEGDHRRPTERRRDRRRI
jgi:site-specific recombinase XerC